MIGRLFNSLALHIKAITMMRYLPTCVVLFALLSAGPSSAQWEQVNNGLDDLTSGAYTLGASDAYVFAKAGNQFYRSADNGESWTAATVPVASNPTECGSFFNGRYFAGLNATGDCIYYTEDNGDTWTAANGGPTATVVRGFFAYGDALYAYTSTAGIYRTVDGDTWTAVNSGLNAWNVVGMAEAGPFFVAATVGGAVFRTFSGVSWTLSTGFGSGDLNGENVWRMGNYLYYSAWSGAEYTSSDYGDTWTDWTQPSFFGQGLIEVKRFNDNLYMETRHSTGGGLRDSLFLTTDEGETWSNITGNLNAADLNGSGILENDGRLFIAYSMASAGQGIYRSGTGTSVEETRAVAPEVFPNPATDELHLVLPAGSNSLNYTMHDAAGRNVLSGRITVRNGQVDLSSLAPGCYMLRSFDTDVAPVRVVKR